MQTRLLTSLFRTAYQLLLGIVKRFVSFLRNKMFYIIYATVLATAFKNIMSETNTNISSQIIRNEDSSLRLLSRKKRFLIFPEGSSVQLVFCNQHHGYLQIGDIVWFGTTAALAWELPTDPEVYDMFRDQNKIYEATRRTDVIYYLDEDGKVVGRKDYKRKSSIINPAFAKRSTDSKTCKKLKSTMVSIKEMHKKQKDKLIMKNIDATKLEYLRREKQNFYEKLEYFMQTLGWSGEDCIHKMLCLTRNANKQGSFLEEIFKAIFTTPLNLYNNMYNYSWIGKIRLPKIHSEVHNQNNDAQEANGDCIVLYPKCGHV